MAGHRSLQLFAIFYFLSWKVGKWCLLYHSLYLLVCLIYLIKIDLVLFPTSASTNFFCSFKNTFSSIDNRKVK